ncbi:hypothetical protein Thiowin_03309 [Thiorhodovibrio winogradskyi]|uniref:Uncharacterized protein n=1 Tax=Thiorhodovibrio winogradskyi TaxID=77007 RepID=A0ABZ0SB43_9GAMM|nr:hypothetical protein [Thiorhodovibrio winogradskyi]
MTSEPTQVPTSRIAALVDGEAYFAAVRGIPLRTEPRNPIGATRAASLIRPFMICKLLVDGEAAGAEMRYRSTSTS